MVTFTAGAILNALFGKVLKRIIKEVCLSDCLWVVDCPGMHAYVIWSGGMRPAVRSIRRRQKIPTNTIQSRPDGAVLEDPGMPSSHAMVRPSLYIYLYITLYVCLN